MKLPHRRQFLHLAAGAAAYYRLCRGSQGASLSEPSSAHRRWLPGSLFAGHCCSRRTTSAWPGQPSRPPSNAGRAPRSPCATARASSKRPDRRTIERGTSDVRAGGALAKLVLGTRSRRSSRPATKPSLNPTLAPDLTPHKACRAAAPRFNVDLPAAGCSKPFGLAPGRGPPQ
jgi:hypothetical protein